MRAILTKSQSCQLSGDCSNGSAYPASEIAYFKRNYGSDHLKQLHDDRQEAAIRRYALNEAKADEMEAILQQLSHLSCVNDPAMTAPGRSAYSLKQLSENLSQYCRPQARSLRWNEHYQQALASVRHDVLALLPVGQTLKPMAIDAVAASEALTHNFDKNAGYLAFETGRRSKGENIEEALKWCQTNINKILDSGSYDLPLVMAHRSSNSKPIDDHSWKWRCRVILMQDERALLLDGHFAVPFTEMFARIPWGEGSMTIGQVRNWIQTKKWQYPNFYSSDYSKFDVSQAAWLLEDVFNEVVRPCFGVLSDSDERWFKAMTHSYIHKEIHGFDGIYRADGCQVSGSLTTYAYNTIINEIVDRTALLMQGCNLDDFVSLKCGDDNLTLFKDHTPWQAEKHCDLIERYFGIKTTLEEDDYGRSLTDEIHFLSRIWTDDGEYRNIREVLWNLVYPERYRKYDPEVTGVPEERAIALTLLCAVHEQSGTMRQYFDIKAILRDAQVRWGDDLKLYTAMASLGTGFRTSKINFRRDLLLRTA